MSLKNMKSVFPTDLFNFASKENGVNISFVSSQNSICPVSNILDQDSKVNLFYCIFLFFKKIWLSEDNLPQYFILDFSKSNRKANFFKYFAIYCWHDYLSNPAVIEVLASKNEDKFKNFGIFHLKQQIGVQLFEFNKPIKSKYIFIKILINKNFGDNKTYLNNIFFYENINNLKKKEELLIPKEKSIFIDKSEEILNYIPKETKILKNIHSDKKSDFFSIKNSGIKDQNIIKFSQNNSVSNSAIKKNFKFFDTYLRTENNQIEKSKKYITDQGFFKKKEENSMFEDGENLKKYINFNSINNEIQKPFVGFSPIVNNDKEIMSLRSEVSNWNEKFVKIEQNVKSLLIKNETMLNSFENFKQEIFKDQSNNEKEDNEPMNKVIEKMDVFLNNIQEENDKILEENNYLKNKIENKINNIEETINMIIDKSNQESDLEKRISQNIMDQMKSFQIKMMEIYQLNTEKLEEKFYKIISSVKKRSTNRSKKNKKKLISSEEDDSPEKDNSSDSDLKQKNDKKNYKNKLKEIIDKNKNSDTNIFDENKNKYNDNTISNNFKRKK